MHPGSPIEHRADAVFALPELPRRVRVLGDPPGWRSDLAQRGIEVVDGPAYVTVCSPDWLPEALVAAGVVFVDGLQRGAPELRHNWRGHRCMFSLPPTGSPAWLVPAGSSRAAAYALASRSAGASPLRAARNALAARMSATGLVERLVETIAVVGAEARPPALLAALGDVVDPGSDWAMAVAAGSPVRRNTFLLFEAGRAEPRFAVKFARVPGLSAPFDREERGLSLAREHALSDAVAPRQLARVEAAGHHAAVQEAARGVSLSVLLAANVPLRSKLGALEQVVAWLERCARETKTPPAALGGLRERLATEALPRWPAAGEPDDLLAATADVPAVLRHGDLGEDNIFVGDRELTLLDWEWAQRHGLPLADLVYFGSRVLRALDGQMATPPERYLAYVMAGRAPSSARMLGWIWRLAVGLEIEPEAVGPLITLGLVEHAHIGLVERERAEAASGVAHEPSLPERALEAWLEDPALGPTWAGARSPAQA